MPATAVREMRVNIPYEVDVQPIAGRERLLRLGSKLCGAAAACLGLAVLAGWQLDAPLFGAGRAMPPLAAVCFILAGSTLLLSSPRFAPFRIACLLVIALIAGVQLAESVTGFSLGLDGLLFPNKLSRQNAEFPGRISEICASQFLLFCTAPVLARNPRWHREFVVVAVMGVVVAVLLLAGHLFQAQALSAIGSYAPISFPSALGLFVLFAGLHLSQPDVGLAAMLVSPRLGGVTARRVLPFVVGLPFAVGLLVDAFAGMAPNGVSLPLTLVLLMAGLAVVVTGVARRLDATDRERETAVAAMLRSEAKFRATQEASLFGMIILDAVRNDAGRVVDFRHRYINPAALRLMGLEDRSPSVGADLKDCPIHADGGLIRQYIEVMETGRPLDREFATHKDGRARWFRAVVVRLTEGLAISLIETTTQRESERALARAEARYRAVVDTAADAMVVIDEQGIIRSLNFATERIFGYTAAEAVGSCVTLLMPEPYASAHDTSFHAYLETGRPKIIGVGREVEARRKDGLVFPIELTVAEWFDGDKRFFTGIMRDITQRRRVLDALKESEILFRAVFEQAAVGLALVGLDGRLIALNRKICVMLGYDCEEMIGKSFEQFAHPAFVDSERQLLGELLTGRRTSYVVEKKALRKDGSTIWVRLTSSLTAEAGTSRVAVYEDITERTMALEELRATAARLELALDAARAGIWEWDMVTDRQVWSAETCRLVGIDPDTPPDADTWRALVDQGDLVKCRRILRDVFSRGDTQCRLEMRVRHRERGPLWLSALGRVFYSDDGRPTRMFGITLDITDIKRAEQDARAAEEQARAAKEDAERANLAKSQFLAAASHDLRQPVQAMMLLSEALAIRLEGHPAATALVGIQAALNALQMLLGGLLDVSRLDAGVVKADLQPVALATVIDRLATEYGLRAQAKGLRLRAVRTDAVVQTDPVLLERILRNLLENALRYTERGKILVGCRRRGPVVRLVVADTGVGIAKEHQQAVFQEFFQVGNLERHREKGLGLGLSIVKRLTAILGHKLGMASRLGRGSCFTIDLPLAEPTEEPLEAEQTRHRPYPYVAK